MIEILASHATFDHTEYYNGQPEWSDYWHGREDPRVQQLTGLVQQLQTEKATAEASAKATLQSAQKASAEREKRLKQESEEREEILRVHSQALQRRLDEAEKEISQYKEDSERNSEHLQLFNQKLQEKQIEKQIDARPATFLYEEFQGNPAYNIQNFVILSPNKESVYHISLKHPIPLVVGGADDKSWRAAHAHAGSVIQFPQLIIEYSVKCSTVSDLLKCCRIEISDKLLNLNWEEIVNPKEAKVQSIIILESAEEWEKRRQIKVAKDLQDQEESRKLRLAHGHRPSASDNQFSFGS